MAKHKKKVFLSVLIVFMFVTSLGSIASSFAASASADDNMVNDIFGTIKDNLYKLASFIDPNLVPNLLDKQKQDFKNSILSYYKDLEDQIKSDLTTYTQQLVSERAAELNATQAEIKNKTEAEKAKAIGQLKNEIDQAVNLQFDNIKKDLAKELVQELKK